MNMPVIHIIDDDDAIRDSLSFLLETQGYICKIFSSGDEWLASDEQNSETVALLDVRMPGRDGLEVLSLALQKTPNLQIIMMSGHGDIAMAVRAMRNGAIDFIEKPFEARLVIERLTSITQSRRKNFIESPARDAARAKIDLLTMREKEVAKHLVDGLANKAIAHEMGISVRTVETHRAHLMTKLGTRSLSEIVKLALAAE